MRKNIVGMLFSMFAVATVVSAGSVSLADVKQPWQVDTNGVSKIEAFLMTPGTIFGTQLLGTAGATSQPNKQYSVLEGGPWAAGTGYTVDIKTAFPSFEMDVLEWGATSLQENVAFFYNTSDPSKFLYHEGSWSWNDATLSKVSLDGSAYSRAAVPEPATCGMLGAGLIGISVAISRRRRLSQQVK